jgi:hypothetical protein
MIDENMCLLDVETANDTKDALTYDVSCRFLNTQGKIFDERAFVVRDVFVNEHELMKQAYYASKMPEYSEDIRAGKRQMINFLDMRFEILKLMKEYDCHTVAAYNCSFDRNALNTTLRYLTKSKFRWFFPYDTKFVCIWNMACNTICQTSEYKSFAELNRYYSNHGKNYRATAETVYAFLSQNPNFSEEHKGMEDVRIEHEIMKECLKMNDELMGISRGCWQKVKRGALCLAQ